MQKEMIKMPRINLVLSLPQRREYGKTRQAAHWLAGLATLLLATLVQADSYGIKGVTLGSHISLIASDPKFICRPVKSPTGDRICSLGKNETETIVGAAVHSMFYYYDQTVLTGIVISLDEKHFQSVVKGFSEKYGIPVRRTETIKNLSGRSFEDQTYTWRQTGESIVAQRYSGRLDRSSIRISDEGAASRIKQKRELLEKQPLRDL